MLVGLFKRFR
uniref:Uncharacterized protein n=1 Tax=Anguilla anguilla TaxID=7936 RepID=A0A0E9Q5L9_ANGAN